MVEMIDKAGLKIATALVQFIEQEALPGTDITPLHFWKGMADIYNCFAAENARLLTVRSSLQKKIDDWHEAHNGEIFDVENYKRFLRKINYLVTEPEPFSIAPVNVDEEVAKLAGPQLVVPILNPRFLLNAANARWGSLYDALYGTDVIKGGRTDKGYNPERGAKVIAWSKAFLDRVVPLAQGSWTDWTGGTPNLADTSQLIGYAGDNILLRQNGLHIELVIDRTNLIGRDDPGGIADVILESAISTICDLEDSVAAVDAEDKVEAYKNWLGLMKGDLEATFEKEGRTLIRRLASDRHYTATDGSDLVLHGRSLLFVRNVGHLMTTPAVRLPDGKEAPEGILDGIITSMIALHDLKRQGRFTNSRAGSIYIVKPKMHGPDETEFANRLFNAIEDMLGLARHTIKVGVMDEERRTSTNLAACIYAVKDRIVFINTGFLDRTGDEIHTSMKAGPMIRKNQMKNTNWITAYEERNVQIGLACGFSGKAQIGKGMWAAPDCMADMLDQKIAHPLAGANTAWVPSPTASTLHAIHYHEIDVLERQKEIKTKTIASMEKLLSVPTASGHIWDIEEVLEELENNAQGILGYVVRWVDHGIGCSKVPDIHDIGLMEDRATLRISSQHMANWLLHGIVTPEQIDNAFTRMAAKVDEQNANDPLYLPMNGREHDSFAFQAARALVFEGVDQPNGYTEPLLHLFRTRAKKQDKV